MKVHSQKSVSRILHRRFSISAQEYILPNVDRGADHNIWRCRLVTTAPYPASIRIAHTRNSRNRPSEIVGQGQIDSELGALSQVKKTAPNKAESIRRALTELTRRGSLVQIQYRPLRENGALQVKRGTWATETGGRSAFLHLLFRLVEEKRRTTRRQAEASEGQPQFRFLVF